MTTGSLIGKTLGSFEILEAIGQGGMALAAVMITIVSCTVFCAGLRRYESGNALNVNV